MNKIKHSIVLILVFIVCSSSYHTTYWVYISGEISFTSEVERANNDKLILTSEGEVLAETTIKNNGEYTLNYLINDEQSFQLHYIVGTDTVLLKSTTTFESQFVVWNFKI